MTRPLLLLASSCWLLACGAGGGGTPKTPTKAGKSVACYVADQFVCHERAGASDQTADNVAVACSSTSGVPSGPAACPKAAFAGKCTSNDDEGVKIERFYTGADVAYAADFCVNTAHGAWSTEF